MKPSPPKFKTTKSKILSLQTLKRKVRAHQTKGERVVFTNGCFDLLHIGHVTLLEQARSKGDVLVVALNSDHSLRDLKGQGRPAAKQEDRLRLIAALACVDYVILFDAPTPIDVIKALVPDVLIKGADWKLDQIVGADVVLAAGGKIVRVDLVEGYSTTQLIKRIRSGKAAV